MVDDEFFLTSLPELLKCKEAGYNIYRTDYPVMIRRRLLPQEPIIEELSSMSTSDDSVDSQSDESSETSATEETLRAEDHYEVHQEQHELHQIQEECNGKSNSETNSDESDEMEVSDVYPKGQCNERELRKLIRKYLETDLEQMDKEREAMMPGVRFAGDTGTRPKTSSGGQSQRNASTSPKMSDSTSKSSQSTARKTAETQTQNVVTNRQDPSQEPGGKTTTPLSFINKDIKTESKVIVEVTQSRQKQRSEVTSLTEVDDDGRLSRRTQVTTSRHVPTGHITVDRTGSGLNIQDRSSQTDVRFVPTRTPSPVRKAQSEINVTAASDVSTRPASAMDTGYRSTSSIPSVITPTPSMSQMKSDEFIHVPRMGRVNIQDPMHLVVLSPPDSYVTKECSLRRRDGRDSSLLMTLPMNGTLTQWRETSSSTICNEMTSDAFKDDEGQVQRPQGMSMTTETTIDSGPKEAKIQTRSRAARKFAACPEENAITSQISSSLPLDEPHHPSIDPHPVLQPEKLLTGTTAAQSTATREEEEQDVRRIIEEQLHDLEQKEKKRQKEERREAKRNEREQRKERERLERERAERAERAERERYERERQQKNVVMRIEPRELERFYVPMQSHEYTQTPVPEQEQRSTSPLIQLVDTPDVLSPEPEEDVRERIRREKRLKKKRRAKFVEIPPQMFQDAATDAFEVLKRSDDIEEERVRRKDFDGERLRGRKDILDDDIIDDKFLLAEAEAKLNHELETIKEPVTEVKTTTADDGKVKKSGKPETEILTRIIRTTQPDQVDSTKPGLSRTVLEQELLSSDISGGQIPGCRIHLSITFDTPPSLVPQPMMSPAPSRGIIIKELNEDGTSKAGSMEFLDQKSESQSRPQSRIDSQMGSQSQLGSQSQIHQAGAGGEIITETNFERTTQGQETTWKYFMECNYIYGSNTTVRTSITHRRAPPPLASYETSL